MPCAVSLFWEINFLKTHFYVDKSFVLCYIFPFRTLACWVRSTSSVCTANLSAQHKRVLLQHITRLRVWHSKTASMQIRHSSPHVHRPALTCHWALGLRGFLGPLRGDLTWCVNYFPTFCCCRLWLCCQVATGPPFFLPHDRPLIFVSPKQKITLSWAYADLYIHIAWLK